MYCFINSSFAYWWWRIYDGAITYPKGLLNKLPVPFNQLTDVDKHEFKKIAQDMISLEQEYISTKVNAGVAQENIKFPEKYRNKINNKILKIIGCNQTYKIFDKVHANKFFIESNEENEF